MWTRKLAGHFASYQPLNLTDDQLDSFLEFLRTSRRLSESTVSQASHALTGVYDAVAGRKPQLSKKLKWRRPTKPETFTPSEIDRFFEFVKAPTRRTLLETAYGCGLGLSQVLRLRVEDLDLSHSLIRVRGSGSKQRLAAMPISLKEDLSRAVTGRASSEPVWVGNDELSTLSPSAVQKSFKAALRTSGIQKDLTFRSLKFTYVRHLQEQGFALQDILNELGMSSHHLINSISRVGSAQGPVTVSPLDLLPSRTGANGSRASAPPDWSVLHPEVVRVARPRFAAGHLADSVEASLKAVESRVRAATVGTSAEGLHGSKLMQRVFSPKDPILLLDNPATESGRNVQVGYLQIFAGSMTGIRNPKAHDNMSINHHETCHLLYVSSLLMYRLDDASLTPESPPAA